MSNSVNKKAVLVLGMHRSGTSAITAGLDALGVSLGEISKETNFDNVKGFFENKEVVQFNERLFHEFGFSWDNPFFYLQSYNYEKLRPFLAEAVGILSKYYNSVPVWALKDPRMCVFLSFWQDAIRSAQCGDIYRVHILRNPLENAASLLKRREKNQQYLGGDERQSILMWFQHHYQALNAVDDDRNILITFEDLLKDPLQQLKRLASFLEIQPDQQLVKQYVDSFLEKHLKHHSVSIDTLRLKYPDLSFVADFYEQVIELRASSSFTLGTTEEILVGMPDLQLLQTCSSVAAPVFQDAVSVNYLQQSITSLTKSVQDRDSQVIYLKNILKERNEQIAAFVKERAEEKNHIVQINSALNAKRNEFEKLRKKYTNITSSLSWQVISKILPYAHKVPGGSQIVGKVKSAVYMWRLNKYKKLIKESGLFDVSYYLEENPNVKGEGFDPISHFLEHGVFEGRRPNPTFDSLFYLSRYPDVRLSGLNPLLHYILFGAKKKLLTQEVSIPVIENVSKVPSLVDNVRACQPQVNSLILPAEIEKFGYLELMDITRETVMVVSHEGSRTGAPILSYNLVVKLLKKYNVVSLFLGPGPMVEACYKEGAVSLVAPKEYCQKPKMVEKLIDAVNDTVTVKYAFINSIESRGVLGPLGKAYIPSVSLIHEFAAYTRPVSAFLETLLWSGIVIFSSRITHESMVWEYPFLGDKKFAILPQGRCRVPDCKNRDREEVETDITPEPAMEILRPKSFPIDGVVILGAGFVQMRKGVDLFISCAAKVIAKSPDIQYRFVWIGKGYDPEKDLAYSIYLTDQVHRAGLEKYVFFMNEVTDIEAVYAKADIMLLSSRLDPLPNVAIDAFLSDLPVVCFSKTTGIAEVLDNFGLTEFCVADYLNIDDMADKVVKLAQSSDLRQKVAKQAGSQAVDFFNMDLYVEQLDQFAQQAEKRTLQEKEDVSTIVQSGLLNTDYFAPSHLKEKDHEEIVRYYVRSWVSNFSRRKLFPGFHPGVYLEQHGTAVNNVDPLADYILAGKPIGPWCFDVISLEDQSDLVLPELRVGLHIHVFYPDLLPELLTRLRQNTLNVELLVSVVSESDHTLVSALLKEYAFQCEIHVIPNRGRDIGPFLTEFGALILERFDIIGHMHTKKSLDCDELVGKNWYEFLLANLIGDKIPMADIIVGKMCKNSKIGIVFPDDPNIITWDANYQFGEELLNKLGVKNIPQEFVMPVGTMFWARTSVLKKLFDLHLQWDDYPEEPLPYDGTLLHAIERSLGILCSSTGKSIALTNVPGVSR